MQVSGYIVDYETGEPLGGATVRITDYSNAVTKAQTVANDNGYYVINADANDLVLFTHVGYAPLLVTPPDAVNLGTVGLNKQTETLPEVVVTPGANTKYLLLLLALAIVIMVSRKKKKVGQATAALATGALLKDKWTRYVILGIVVIVSIKVLGLFDRLLEMLGLKKSEDTQKLDEAATDPGSWWNPTFWKSGPPGTLILKMETARQYAKRIYNAMGIFDDNEEEVKAVFRNMQTQSQASFLCDVFQQEYNIDCLNFLRGGMWPKDRLSDADVNEITNYVNNLPQYNVV